MIKNLVRPKGITRFFIFIFTIQGEYLMADFTDIDPNRIASKKQIWAVANRFATLTASDKSERFGKVKVFNAILNSLHGKECKLTHADIQKYFECEVVPKEILARVQKPSKKASKVQKVSTKPAETKKVSKKPTLTNRVDSLESKLDQILEALASK